PIFLAWVRTCRYRLSRAATPTVKRSATATTLSPLVSVCNKPEALCQCPSNAVAVRLPRESPPQRVGGNVIDEGALAVDLDHRKPLPVARLELGVATDFDLLEPHAELAADLLDHCPRTLAEVTARRAVKNDLGFWLRQKPRDRAT